MIFFFFLISLLTCHIFNMQHFSRHFDVKNGLVSNKFEIVENPDPVNNVISWEKDNYLF
jgi:hypothetical protein